VNLEFVDRIGPDVFTVAVDTSRWTTAGNWASDAKALAHELNHLLGLDDRYDFIERHAENPKMGLLSRIYWFRIQVRKPPDPQGFRSLMGLGSALLEDDVCKVAGLDPSTCIAARMREPEEARALAFSRLQRAFGILTGMRPTPYLDRPDNPSRAGINRSRLEQMARTFFGLADSTPAEDFMPRITRVIETMRNRMTPGIMMHRTSMIDPKCKGEPSYTIGARLPIHLCPAFFGLTLETRAGILMREAAHLAQILGGSSETLCSPYDCMTPCGGLTNPDTWAHFVYCLTS
jgi:hypothetical protein